MRSHRTQIAPLLSALLLLSATHLVSAAETTATANDEAEKRCLDLNRIKHTKVIDNQHIRFEVMGRDYYMNELPNKCPGLRKDKPFMYQTSLTKLCDLDFITVLENTGNGYMRGASCGLGKFVPYTEEDKKTADKPAAQ